MDSLLIASSISRVTVWPSLPCTWGRILDTLYSMAILSMLQRVDFSLPMTRRIMNLKLIASLKPLTDRLIPKIDLARLPQRYDQNRPANIGERCIFYIIDFAIVSTMGLFFIFEDDFRERVYYLYEHPDHQDTVCLYPNLKWRHPYATRWIIYLFPKVRRTWKRCLKFSRTLKTLIPTYKSSPSIFGPSPKLAMVIHGAGEWAGNLTIPNGCVVNLFSNSWESSSYFVSWSSLLDITFSFTTRAT